MQLLFLFDMMVMSVLGGGGGVFNLVLFNNYLFCKYKYNEVLLNLRVVMIEKMVRFEEVLIVENDEGEIVCEFVKEIDIVQFYKMICECFVYFIYFDVVDIENIMIEKLL